ncbi:MAG: hypothetical protein E7037_04790 [Verrucomicrobia bacterium]|nr:hypothetical protein [Verrucomicrobiota bacterium]
MGSVAKEVGRAYDKVEDAISDGWDKSGMDKVWNEGGLKHGWWNFGAGTAVHHGVKLAESVKDSIIPDFNVDIPAPETQAPGAGVQTNQQSMLSDSLANERRRRAARYAMSDTNRTGNAQMRSSSLKSTLG